MTTEEFIYKAKAIHGDKYDYSKVEYINNHTKVCIICKEHGEFWQRPNDHLSGKGCKGCSRERTKNASIKWTQEKCFIEAQKYTSRSEFALHAASAYNAAKSNKWLSQYSWLKEKHKPNGYWTYENCYIEAQKYTTRHDFERSSGSAYHIAVQNGWINDYIWLTLLRARPWTYETCYTEAKKYTTVTEFRRNNLDAYVRARKNGWLKNYSWLLRTTRAPWTYDECYTKARQYTTKKGFLEGDKLAYHASVKHKWMDHFTWLTDDRIKIYTDKVDCVYRYLFIDQHAVYIGRTIRPNDRDKEHVFYGKDTVARYAKTVNLPVPKMEVIETNLTLEEGLKREDYWTNYYKEKGYLVLNKASTGIGKGSLGSLGANKWTKETCYQEALKYKSRSEFSNGNGSAYDVARRNEWLIEYTWFSEPVKKLDDCWTKEECFEEAKKYKSRKEFIENNFSAYRLALRNDWLKEMDWFVRPQNYNIKWTQETCEQVAKKFSNISEFKAHYATAYSKAKKAGWIETYTWLERKQKPSGYWTKETCFEEAKKYTSRNEFKRNSGSAYNVALKNKWISQYIWFSNTLDLLSVPKKWTEEACMQEAKKYKTKNDFVLNSASAYGAARQNGWIKNYTWLKAGKKPNGYWNHDRCKEEAAKYENRTKFCKGSPAAFDSSAKHQWLDEFFLK